MPSKPGPKTPPDHELSDAARQAISAWKAAVDEEERLRNLAHKALADELTAAPDLPVAVLAKNPAVPWGIGTLWAIVKKYNVPPRQPNKAKRTESA